jgi:hypothetical protein
MLQTKLHAARALANCDDGCGELVSNHHDITEENNCIHSTGVETAYIESIGSAL